MYPAKDWFGCPNFGDDLSVQHPSRAGHPKLKNCGSVRLAVESLQVVGQLTVTPRGCLQLRCGQMSSYQVTMLLVGYQSLPNNCWITAIFFVFWLSQRLSIYGKC